MSASTVGDSMMDGQVAVVTGGARGIGAAICRTLFGRGVLVVCLDLSTEGLAELVRESSTWPGSQSSELHVRQIDITAEDQVLRCIAEIDRDFGRVDIVVNNAGIPARPAVLWETDTDHWKRIFDVHVHGAFFVLRAVIPVMLRRSYGRIVNVSSMAGKEGNPNASAYSSAKSALIAMTKSVGKELATSGILVNAITPGFIETPLVKTFTAQRQAELLAKVPMGRPGRADEVAELVLFLASERVGFSTGAVFDISGGRATY